MKIIVSSLFLAFLLVAANAASLEKVEHAEHAEHAEHSNADKVEPASAVPAVPVPTLKTAPVEIVEAKSGEVAQSGEKNEGDAPVVEPKALAPEQNSEKLPVTILYEALCTDSRNFITRELGKEYSDFRDYISVNFVPFGKSKSLDAEGKNFECHHGEKECVGNRIHSCALNCLKSKPDAQKTFVVCQMRNDSEPTGRECVEQAGANWDEMTACVDGELGRKLQLAAEAETKAARDPLTNVPTVIFDGKFDEEWHTKAVKGLRSALCERLADKKLETCAAKV